MSKRKSWTAGLQQQQVYKKADKGKGKATRTSGRQVVLSKSMRVVDDATRRAVKSSQLEALEADNYVENDQGDESDDNFQDDDGDGGDGGPKERKQGRRGGGGSGGGGGGGYTASGGGSGKKGKSKWRQKTFRNLGQVVDDLVGGDDTDMILGTGGSVGVAAAAAGAVSGGGASGGVIAHMYGPTYASIAAPDSQEPPRHFCAECGYWGHYTCTRCGSRFCSVKCQTSHKEGCIKYAG